MAQSVSTTTKDSRDRDGDAHHVHEFGELDDVVHVDRASDVTVDADCRPIAPARVKTALVCRARWARVRRKLFRERQLMQYIHNGTLHRAPGLRAVSREELFLDLTIVAAIAALGHELRAYAVSWRAVEKFMLLFAGVYSAWRQVVFLWNWWGVKEDLHEKVGIYVSFVCITGIALGAHEAFAKARLYVGVSTFLATFIPAFGSSVLALREAVMRNPANKINEAVLFGVCSIAMATPYLAAAFVPSDRAARILYWVGFGLQFICVLVPYVLYTVIHRNVDGHTRVAMNIELMVEKFEVLTMIVLGESVIGLLFEAGAVIYREEARIGSMYVAAVGATALLYALQTLYIQVDSPILKGGRHAIRHKTTAGIGWSIAHMPYHMSLILFATGLGFALRDIALPPTIDGSAKLMARAGADSAQKGSVPAFNTEARWVYAAGWGSSLLLSGLISTFHKGGPRATTKPYRLAARFVVVTGLMVGLPFAELSAGQFHSVMSAVTAVLALTEFVLVQMDRIGFFRSELGFSGSSTDGGVNTSTDAMLCDDDDVENTGVELGGKLDGGGGAA